MNFQEKQDQLSGYDRNEFAEILRNSNNNAFTSYRYAQEDEEKGFPVEFSNHIPTMADAISHLKLLKAFSVLKRSITLGRTEEQDIKKWQVFVTQATRRFILFFTSLKKFLNEVPVSPNDEQALFAKGTSRDPHIISTLDSMLPPLDVVMVWHAFLLNPRSFYDNCMRNDMFSFACFPLPLKRISDSIDSITFEYRPTKEQKENYLNVIWTTSAKPEDLLYHFNSYSMNEGLLSIYCPICEQILLENIPYTNNAKTGFADCNFAYESRLGKCHCAFPRRITHEELRKRQLSADFGSSIPLPGIYRNFSSVTASNTIREKRKPILINESIKETYRSLELFSFNDVSLESLITKLIEGNPRDIPLRIILRQYLQMNLVSLTIERGLPIYEDLVGCVMRQERFVEKINEIDWLHSPVIKESLVESIIRYSRFFELLTKGDLKHMLVPTLDIDLIWHTHQLGVQYYFTDCMKSENGSVIDHDDKVDNTRLHMCFELTTRLYKRKFNQEYSICFCWYCVCIRNRAQSKLKTLFKSKKSQQQEYNAMTSSPLFFNSLGLTHISVHSAIVMPSTFAEKLRKIVEWKYKSKKKGSDFPWDSSSMNTYSAYPYLFVIPPLLPIASEHCQFYNNGLCCSISDTQDTSAEHGCATSNCTGTSGSCSGGSGGDGGSNCGSGCGGD
ncbi:uncharacterized protein RJT20DRAFT_15825 [Scheffersomyces xylosifermentans]|uniref:uncharacterized protein n=1 Tax=Scheffersomyces xylosifermentans TaxID=1304137 RepID=UPI00315CF9E9